MILAGEILEAIENHVNNFQYDWMTTPDIADWYRDLQNIIHGSRARIEGVMIVITIDEHGGIQVMNEETVVALIFGDERAEEPYFEVRCHLDFIAYFCKLLGIPIKFKNLQDSNQKETPT